MQNTKIAHEKPAAPNSVLSTQYSVLGTQRQTLQQNMQNEKFAHEKPAAQDSVLSTQYQAPNTDSFPHNMQIPAFAHEKAMAPDSVLSTLPAHPSMQNEKFAHEKAASPDTVHDTQPSRQNLQNPTFAHEKTSLRWQRLQAEVLAHKELIAQDGCLAAIWKTYRGKRLGPYYRVEFRENRATRTIYIGRDENLATMASALIDELKQPREQQRILRQLRRTIWAGLRRSLREAEIHAAPLGYRRRGFNFHKQK